MKYPHIGIHRKLQHFYRRENGTAVIEMMIMIPFLFTMLLAMVVYFNAYRTKNLNLKAAYTISDMLSRENPIVDESYIDGLHTVFRFSVGSPQPSKIRVTKFQFDTEDPNNPSDGRYILKWSHGTTGATAHTEATVEAMKDVIPIMAHGATALMVETHMKYIAPFNVGIDPVDFTNLVITRPRWGQGPCWETCIN